MTSTSITTSIEAPVELVFKTVADIRQFSNAIPHITRIEFLTEQQYGLGTRFKETRLMKGREATTELEVKEFIENERIRIVADSHGTVWDTVFTVEGNDNCSTLTVAMEAKAYKFLPKLINPLIKGMVEKAIAHDMDAVKTFCEKQCELAQ